MKVKADQSCLTLWGPMDCIVHGILQARILEWVAFPFSRGSSQPRDQTEVSWITGGFFTSWVTRESQVAAWAQIKTEFMNQRVKKEKKKMKEGERERERDQRSRKRENKEIIWANLELKSLYSDWKRVTERQENEGPQTHNLIHQEYQEQKKILKASAEKNNNLPMMTGGHCISLLILEAQNQWYHTF